MYVSPIQEFCYILRYVHLFGSDESMNQLQNMVLPSLSTFLLNIWTYNKHSVHLPGGQNHMYPRYGQMATFYGIHDRLPFLWLR